MANLSKNDSSVELDELREVFTTFFGERDVWEVIDRKNNLDEVALEMTFKMLNPDYVATKKEKPALTRVQKKMFLKQVCGGKYSEEDLIFIRVVDDFSSGFAFTKDSFCIGGDLLDFQTHKFPIVMYNEITAIELGGYSSDWAEKKAPYIHIRFKTSQSDYEESIFFNYENVRDKYTTQIITEPILWQIGKFLEFVKP